MTSKGAGMLEAIKAPQSPFPGLRPFEFHESHLFFGRDGQVEKLIAKLANTRFVAVVGTSGSGKSSLVRAGLLPALVGGMLTSAAPKWRIAVVRPGNNPIGVLARALNRPEIFGSDDADNTAIQILVAEATLRRGSRGLVETVRQAGMPSDENLLVVVDQFEELFRFAREAARMTKDESDRYQNDAAAFVKLLLEAHTQRDVNIYVALTMRSDFLGDCAKFWDLPEAINDSQYLIPRLTRDQLREVITGPAGLGGGEIASRLISELLNSVGDDQDQLPVLQHLLMRVWGEWRERRLELEVEDGGRTVRRPHREIHRGEAIDLCCYEAVGGMVAALKGHAEEAFNELPDDRHRQIAEKLFKCLTERGEDNREIRRQVTLAEICAVAGASAQEVRTIIETFRLPGRSFLMPPAGTPLDDSSLIDISHESLIRGWQRLRDWVGEEAESARIYRRVVEDATEHNKKRGELWYGLNLQRALIWQDQTKPNKAWAARYHSDFESAMSFLSDSVSKHEADELAEKLGNRKEARRRLLLLALLFLAALGSVSTVLTFYAFNQRERAKEQQRIAEISRKELAQREAQFETQRAQEQTLLAEEKANEAERDRLTQLELRREADSQRVEAEKAKSLAIRRGNDADHLRARAESGARFTRQLLYDANMNLAWQAYDASEIVRVKELLNGLLQDSDESVEANLRGFDWYHLWRLSHTEVATLERVDPLASVQSVAFSPDGKLLAIGSRNDTVKLWDMSTREKPALLKGNSISAWSVAFSHDGNKLAVGCGDGSVKLWDVRKRLELATLRGASGTVWSVAFSPDDRLLATGSADKSLRLWETTTGRQLATIVGSSSISSVAFSPDGRTLLSGSGRPTPMIKLWDIGTVQEVATIQGHVDSISSVAFSPDGKTFATGSWDNTVKLWDSKGKHRELAVLRHSSQVYSVAFSPDGKMLATGSDDRTVKLWDANVVSPQEDDAEVKIDVRSELAAFKGHSSTVMSVVFSPDGQTVASGGLDTEVKLWPSTTPSMATLKGHTASVWSIAFSPDGQMFATVGEDRTVKLWDVKSQQELATLEISTGPVRSAAFSSDGKTLATASLDGTLKLWDVESRQARATLKGPFLSLISVALSPDGKLLAAGLFDGTVMLWDVNSRRETWTLNGGGRGVVSLAFSPDGKKLATGSRDGTLKVWDVNSRSELASPERHALQVNSVAFSPDGEKLASGSSDATVKMWDVRSKRELATLKGHRDGVQSVAFSEDGKRLASGSRDRTVKLWDVNSHQELATLRGHEGSVTCVAFSSDGKTLAAGSMDKTVKLWFAATNEEVAAQVAAEKDK